MTGEALAVLAALAYGLAGVSIVRSKDSARGDNGLFLSVIVTALLSWVLWVGWGTATAAELLTSDGLWAIGIFALAGLLANVFGRQTMYRATERIGAVRAGLLRRLTPVFALPCAFVILGQEPGPPVLAGGALVLAGVLVYIRIPAGLTRLAPISGVAIGALSALSYALSYTFRSLGLEGVPDAALGTFAGALVGAASMLAIAVARRGVWQGWRHLVIDRNARHWQTALALSAGQLLQFFALKTASVVSVAVLGTLEVLFSALIVMVFTKCEVIALKRLFLAAALSVEGTMLLFLA